MTVAASAPAISGAYRSYTLFILFLIYTFSFLDRQILAILMLPIMQDLDLNYTQMGLLTGTAFALFYAGLGIPVALLADRWHRLNIISISLAIFSVMTALSGLAQNFVQLALARIGVGIGEAGTSPPSHSIISDIYARAERGTALALMAIGVNAGVLLGFLIGGQMSTHWRDAFFVVGIPGILLAILARLTLREPRRGASDGVASVADAPKVGEVFAFLWSQRAFRHLSIGFALSAFVGYSGVSYIASYLNLSFDMPLSVAGTWLAFVVGISGGLGTFASGWLADRFGRKDVRWYMWIVMVFLIGSIPFSALVYLAPSAGIALAAFIPAAFVGNFAAAPCIAMTQSLVRLRMRALASAVLFFIVNMIGLGLGPLTTGALTDFLKESLGDEAMRYALLMVSSVAIWAAAHFWFAAKTLKDDLARAAA